MKWTIKRFQGNQEQLILLWKSIYVKNSSLPVADQPELLLPLLSSEYPDKKLFLLIGENDEDIITILPLVVNIREKYFLKWKELGLLYDSHLWLRAWPGCSFENYLVVWGQICKTLDTSFLQWTNFVLRNVQLGNIPEGFTNNSVAYFDVSHCSKISDIISKKILKNIIRLQKKCISRVGDCFIQVFNARDAANNFDRFINVESKGWKGTNDEVSLHNKAKDIFKKSFTSDSSSYEALVFIYGYKGCDIASAFGYVSGSCLYLHSICFDSEYAEFSPGSQLVYDIINHAINDENICEVNFVTDPVWLQRWHPKKRSLITLVSYRRSIKGILFKQIIYVFNVMKSLYIKHKS